MMAGRRKFMGYQFLFGRCTIVLLNGSRNVILETTDFLIVSTTGELCIPAVPASTRGSRSMPNGKGKSCFSGSVVRFALLRLVPPRA